MWILVGTTVVAFKTRLGIIVGVDSLVSSRPEIGPDGTAGDIVSRNYNKYFEISHNCACGMAGNLGKAETVLERARTQWRFKVNYNNVTETPAEIAKYLQHQMQSVQPFGGPASNVDIITAGFDDNQVASIYTTNAKTCLPEDKEAIGSGAVRARVILNEEGAYDYEMSEDAAKNLARRAITYAGLGDVCTGGNSIKVFLITYHGMKKLSDDTYEELVKLYYGAGPMEVDKPQ
ncbi:hypothetical protein MKW94_027843, partial [Papaver nudicaule]|nr:hypothetical protein [Papaver nudicaule]